MTAQRQAASLLSHYFRTAFEAAGLDWDGDHQAEIEEAVDALVDMVRDEIRIARDEASTQQPDANRDDTSHDEPRLIEGDTADEQRDNAYARYEADEARYES